MGKAILLLLIVAVVGGVVYVIVTEPDWYRELTKQAKRGVQEGIEDAARERKGFTPAKTADEAADKFRKAVKERDYKTAAIYTTTEYGDQLRKAAPAAEPLGKSIDALWEELERQGAQTDRTKAYLLLLEPFPRGISTEVKEKDGKAVVVIDDEVRIPKGDWVKETEKMDQFLFHALKRDIPPELEVKSEGAGEDKTWKIHVPVSQKMVKAVDRLTARYAEHVKALDKLQEDLKKGGMSKADVEKRLKADLEALK